MQSKMAFQPTYNFAGKEILFGTECREKMLEGCNKLADAV